MQNFSQLRLLYSTYWKKILFITVRFFLLMWCFVGILHNTNAQTKRYVNASIVGGANDGSSWGNAFKDLQNALSVSNATDQIWVAKGTYYPTTTSDRTLSFIMKNGVSIYGGFLGLSSETLITQRDWKNNITILSGDIGTTSVASDNSYHVVSNNFQANPLTNTAILDGFSIVSGNANGTSPHDSGGGMFNISASPTLNNIIFSGNVAALEGGAMLNNTASSPKITRCTFKQNTASIGGGMSNKSSSSPILNSVSFLGNSATNNGGGMYNFTQITATLNSVIFLGNTADTGGGMYNTSSSSPNINNCTFSGNKAIIDGGAMYNTGSTSNPKIKNSIFWGNSNEITNFSSNPVITKTVIKGKILGTGIFNGTTNPLFINQPTIALGITGNLRLNPCSPALNVGDNTGILGVDLDENQRIFNTTVDLGAYEVQTQLVATASNNSPKCAGVNINLTGSGSGNGTSVSYSWSSNNGFSSTEQNPIINNADVSFTGIYTITVTDTYGCLATATTSVIVNANPVPLASSNTPICSGTTLNLSGGNGSNTYSWTGVNSFTSSAQNPTIPNATTAATGSYRVLVTDVNGCTATATTSAVVNQTPITPTTQADTQIVFGNSISLTATACTGNLKWYQSADNQLVTMPVSPTTTFQYYAKCEETANGITCISNQSNTLTLTVLSPVPPVATGATICAGSNVSLTATGCVDTFVLNWYQNVNDALITMPVSPSTTTDYYAKCVQTFNSVTLTSAKSNAVTVTVLNPSTPVATGGTIYKGQNITLNVTGCVGAGFVVKWYETSTNNSVVMPVSPILTTQYYAKCEQTVNSVTCASLKGNDVTVIVIDRIFVDISKITAPIQNGNTWTTAYGDLQTGLAAAAPNVEVWVAKGTYKTTSTITKTIYFYIPTGVKIFGGFAGTEDALNIRDFRINTSTLSGEIGNINTTSDNSYHVVLFDGSSNNTVLDGFTITGGNSNFNPNNKTGNQPTTSFSQTTTTIETGGGIALQNGSNPLIVNCIIVKNDAIFGGGIYASDISKPTIINCKIIANQATFGSGIYLENSGNAILTNTLIAGNKGIGSVYNNASNPILTNCTLSGNGGYMGNIFNSNSQPIVKNSIIWGNAPPFNDTQSIISNSMIQGGYLGVGNLNYDPQFVAASPEAVAPNNTGDYHLKATSLAIDRGDNGSFNLTDVDLDRNLRRFSGGRIDMGAYEFQGASTVSLVISIASGNWNANSTWDLGHIPQINDIVIIDSNHNVNVNTTTEIAKNIKFIGTGKIQFNSSATKLNVGF